MNLIECIKGALNQLLANKMRTFLTMLGMFIGIGAVIMVLSVGEGVKDMMLSMFDDIGRGSVTINANHSETEYRITVDDLEAIEAMPEVEEALFIGENVTDSIKDYKGEDKMIVIQGVSYNMDVVQNVEILGGRMYTREEESAKSRVIVVSETYAQSIMGVEDRLAAVGETVELTIGEEKHEFTIIGVFEVSTFQGMPVDMMPIISYIPFSVVDQILNFGNMTSTQAAFLVNEAYDPTEVGYQVGRLLDKRHHIENGYSTQSAGAMIDQIDTIMNLVTTFIGFVAAISLLVGGIGIMNIMLVTVKERTREIGIRKAVGATNGEILRQFLIEAIILTIIGGLIGMVIGYLGGVILADMMAITVTLTSEMIIFAVGTSSAIGIIFGVYPARQAGKLDPVEALRYE